MFSVLNTFWFGCCDACESGLLIVFKLESGKLDDISVFAVYATKQDILDGEDQYLIEKEKQAFSVAGVKGPTVKIGSMEEVNTNGNWGKDLSNKQ